MPTVRPATSRGSQARGGHDGPRVPEPPSPAASGGTRLKAPMQTPPSPPAEAGHHLDLSRIAQDLQIRKIQVESVVHLLDEGNTIPFITRYRKERTGGLNEDVLRAVQQRVAQLR